MDISIRRAEPGDFEALARQMEDPSAYGGTLQLPYPSRELWRKRLRRSHAMGMAVPAPWQGKGVGTALMGALVDIADNWLNVFRLELTVYVDNEPAISLYRKFGFGIEGTHKAYALRNGEYVDAHFMARLKPKRVVV